MNDVVVVVMMNKCYANSESDHSDCGSCHKACPATTRTGRRYAVQSPQERAVKKCNNRLGWMFGSSALAAGRTNTPPR